MPEKQEHLIKTDQIDEKRINDPIIKPDIGSFGQRLEELIEGSNWTRRSLAAHCGTTEASIRNYIKGRMPQIDVAYKLAQSFKLSLDELITGQHVNTQTKSDEYAYLPVFNVSVSTGHGAASEDEKVLRRLAFRKNWLSYRGFNEADLVVVVARGDSMEPTIHNSNTVLVNTTDNKLTDGSIFVLRLGDDLYAKRLQKRFDGSVELISDNKEYSNQIVTLDEIDQLQIVGKVVWVGKDLY